MGRKEKTRTGLRERQTGPESPARLSVQLGTWHQSGVGRGTLASGPLQQKSEDEGREQAYNILGLGESHALR